MLKNNISIECTIKILTMMSVSEILFCCVILNDLFLSTDTDPPYSNS